MTAVILPWLRRWRR